MRNEGERHVRNIAYSARPYCPFSIHWAVGLLPLAPVEIPPEGAPSAEALRAAVDEESTVDVLNQQPLYRPTMSSHKPEQRRGSRP
jgi:hypothetical protein